MLALEDGVEAFALDDVDDVDDVLVVEVVDVDVLGAVVEAAAIVVADALGDSAVVAK